MGTSASSTILLVFRCGYEYVFTHGQPMATLVVMLSSTALNLFDRHKLKADDLAKQVAEWALFDDPTREAVDLSVEGEDLSAFCHYYFTHAQMAERAC